MMLQPPCAEDELQGNASYTHCQAGCVSAVVEQSESPVVEQERSDDGLTKVVGETHLAVWRDLYHPVSGRSTVVEECDS